MQKSSDIDRIESLIREVALTKTRGFLRGRIRELEGNVKGGYFRNSSKLHETLGDLYALLAEHVSKTDPKEALDSHTAAGGMYAKAYKFASVTDTGHRAYLDSKITEQLRLASSSAGEIAGHAPHP